MKILIFLLFIPFLSNCQTVHVEKGKILYKGTESADRLSKEELYKVVKASLLTHVHGHNRQLIIDDEKNGELAMNGEQRLVSTFNLLRVLEYSIKISVKNNNYKYHIDSVFVRENERHVRTIDIPSEDILKGMDISGPVASNTEKQLNEIDMDIQKILAQIRKDVMHAETNPKKASSK